jgi:hypothetical protein
MFHPARFFIALGLLAGCANSNQPPSHTPMSAASTASPEAGRTFQSPAMPSSITRVVPDCARLGSGAEACGYSLQLQPQLCAGGRCRKLVIYFAGGQMTCPSPGQSGSYLAQYASRGYVAACARIYETAEGSGNQAYFREGPRVDLLVESIVSDPVVRAAWSGEYLLFSGVSHGASAPVVAMAREPFAAKPSWHGTRYTGACFLDGTYNPAAQLQFAYANTCRAGTSVLSYQRVYERYCQWPRGAFPNFPGTWPGPQSCQALDAAVDSLASVSGDQFAIRDWKLVECGSALPACAQDVIPAIPIASLCGRIAGAAGHSCQFASFPQISHIQCGADPAPNSACMSWFESRLP